MTRTLTRFVCVLCRQFIAEADTSQVYGVSLDSYRYGHACRLADGHRTHCVLTPFTLGRRPRQPPLPGIPGRRRPAAYREVHS